MLVVARNLKTYKKFESRVYQNSFAEEGSSEILEDIEMMKDMLSDIEDFEDVGVHIKNWLDYIEIMINKDDWYNNLELTKQYHEN